MNFKYLQLKMNRMMYENDEDEDSYNRINTAPELWVVSHGELWPPRPPALLSCDPTLEPVTRDTRGSPVS